MQRNLTISEVIEACKQRAFDYQASAVQVRTAGDRDKDLEYSAKAQAMNQLIEDLLGPDVTSHEVASAGEIDSIAREINPQLFSAYDAYIDKLRREGHDDGYIIYAAEAVYGEAMTEARDKARDSLANDRSSNPQAEEAYGRGIEDAISWHEHHARQADAMENREPLPEKKIKLRKRAARHRLYAKTMRDDFSAIRARKIQREAENARLAARQASLFPAASDVSLDVERSFP